MSSNIAKFEGKLVLDGNKVALETKEGKFYPIPFPIQTSMSGNAMRAVAYRTYEKYIGQVVGIAGNSDGETIYDGKVIRIPKKDGPGKPGAKREPIEYGEEYWNNRVPKANILFTARKLPGYPMSFKVDVRQMITINDSVIQKDLADNSLMVSDPNNCDDDIYLIYHHSRVKEINPYIYEYDNKAFGCEFFMYPYELRQLQKGDCDDWGIELASYLISAGVPEWRVRCVAGRTFSGGGHLTVYVLADDLQNWYHLNSTTPWSLVMSRGYGKLSDFPKHGDSSDSIGIKDVWFSFNNKYAWHAFETYESGIDAQRETWMNNIRISPVFD